MWFTLQEMFVVLVRSKESTEQRSIVLKSVLFSIYTEEKFFLQLSEEGYPDGFEEIYFY